MVTKVLQTRSQMAPTKTSSILLVLNFKVGVSLKVLQSNWVETGCYVEGVDIGSYWVVRA